MEKGINFFTALNPKIIKKIYNANDKLNIIFISEFLIKAEIIIEPIVVLIKIDQKIMSVVLISVE